MFTPYSLDYIPNPYEADGISDHVGIVEKVENGTIYTIEGNCDDACKQFSYPLGDSCICGFGTPQPYNTGGVQKCTPPFHALEGFYMAIFRVERTHNYTIMSLLERNRSEQTHGRWKPAGRSFGCTTLWRPCKTTMQLRPATTSTAAAPRRRSSVHRIRCSYTRISSGSSP